MATPTILIVDSDPTIGFALTRLFESHGELRAVVALTANEAEAEIARGPVDAMILDYHLLGMRGDAFFFRACALQPGLAQRTIFISGDPSTPAIAAMLATRRPFLVKPFLVSALITELRGIFTTAARTRMRSA